MGKWVKIDLTFRKSSRPVPKPPSLTLEPESSSDGIKYYLELPELPEIEINPLGIDYSEED